MLARESVYLRSRRVTGFGLGESWRPVGLREVGLGSGPGDYAMLWSPGAQLMSNGREAFVHDGSIGTAPSHDLTHLIVAANGGTLGWRPAGEHGDICRAEYNAVMLENLLDRIYRMSKGELSAADVVPEVVRHLDWFVNKHFAPFPASAKQAAQQFVAGILAEPAVRLSPHFFDMKHAESGDARHMDKTWTARFRADDAPVGWDELRAETHRQLDALQRRAR